MLARVFLGVYLHARWADFRMRNAGFALAQRIPGIFLAVNHSPIDMLRMCKRLWRFNVTSNALGSFSS